MNPAETYELLRSLTSPVVAVTSRRGDKRNGMISDGAIRASIVPDMPRLGIFIHKFNFSHELIYETGCFALHILHTGQMELVQNLGFRSGREHDKLADVPHRPGERTGVPILDDCWCWFECEVCNVMDTGASTFFMGDAVATGSGPGTEIMAPSYLRSRLPADLVQAYVANLATAQDAARQASKQMRSIYSRK